MLNLFIFLFVIACTCVACLMFRICCPPEEGEASDEERDEKDFSEVPQGEELSSVKKDPIVEHQVEQASIDVSAEPKKSKRRHKDRSSRRHRDSHKDTSSKVEMEDVSSSS